MLVQLILLYTSFVLCQIPSCSSGNNLPTFNVCVRDALMGNTGNMFQQVTEACQSLVLDQKAYYTCLCDKNAAVVNCFNLFCPAEQSATGFAQSQTQFCAAVKGLPSSSSSTTVASSVASMTVNSMNVIPSATASASSTPSAPSSKSDGTRLMHLWFLPLLMF